MTIQEAQNTVDEWIKAYGVRYFISRRYGEQSRQESDPRKADNGKAALGEEMADVLWVLLCLANQTGINLTEELQKSIEKKTKRDAKRHLSNPKLT